MNEQKGTIQKWMNYRRNERVNERKIEGVNRVMVSLASIGLDRLWNCALEASSAVAGKANSLLTVLSIGGADEGRVFMPLSLFLLSSPLFFCVGFECFL